jgi:hypothetical protein
MNHPAYDIEHVDYSNPVLERIYYEAVAKFIKRPEGEIKFDAIRDYCKKKLIHRKQCTYTYGLPMIKSVCAAVAEPFEEGALYACPDAVNYRDLYFSIIH